MKAGIRIAAPSIALSLAAASVAFAQQADTLGKVEFPNSCSPAVQEKFVRGVAMLHSFYYSAAQTAFEEVAAEDNSCAIAAWGYASILMLNPLQGIGSSSKNAQLAQAAIDKGRKLGATTQRERDYLDAVAAYYEDFANRPERARQVARAEAYEALAAKYPDDDYGSAQRIRGFPAARAEPLSRTVRRGAGGGAVRQPRQGAAQLLQAD